jgi:hypothetical protein
MSVADWLTRRSKHPWLNTIRNLTLGTLTGAGTGLGYNQWYRNERPFIYQVLDAQARREHARRGLVDYWKEFGGTLGKGLTE